MRKLKNEEVIICINARRKGRSQNPCEIGICVINDGRIILRTEDCGGTSPIVAVLGMEEAQLLQMGLAEAVQRVTTI